MHEDGGFDRAARLALDRWNEGFKMEAKAGVPPVEMRLDGEKNA